MDVFSEQTNTPYTHTCIYLDIYRLHLFSTPWAVKNAIFSVACSWDCRSTVTNLNVLHFNSIKQYLKEAFTSEGLFLYFLFFIFPATILKHIVFEAWIKEEKSIKHFFFTARRHIADSLMEGKNLRIWRGIFACNRSPSPSHKKWRTKSNWNVMNIFVLSTHFFTI